MWLKWDMDPHARHHCRPHATLTKLKAERCLFQMTQLLKAAELIACQHLATTRTRVCLQVTFYDTKATTQSTVK